MQDHSSRNIQYWALFETHLYTVTTFQRK